MPDLFLERTLSDRLKATSLRLWRKLRRIFRRAISNHPSITASDVIAAVQAAAATGNYELAYEIANRYGRGAFCCRCAEAVKEVKVAHTSTTVIGVFRYDFRYDAPGDPEGGLPFCEVCWQDVCVGGRNRTFLGAAAP